MSPANLLKLLRALEPSGPDGFEGWVADALSELTGRAFRLMKPGPQGGADLLSDAAAGEALVAVEAKRFREATQLSLDLLLAKLADLDQTRPEVDLWILAATRQVSADDSAKLEASGSRYGLDVLVVDTRPGADGLSPLDVLSAAAPRAAASHFPDRPDLHLHLEAIRSNPRFAVALGRLQVSGAPPPWLWWVDGQLAFAVAHIQGISSSMRACGQPWTKRVSKSVR